MTASADGAHVARLKVVAPTIEVLPVRTPTLPPATHTNTFMVGTGQAVLIEPACFIDSLKLV